MRCKPLPEAERLWELFDYDPIRGQLLRRPGTYERNKYLPEVAGSKSKNARHWTIFIDGISYLLHRIIWKWFTGLDPEGIIEHIDDDSNDNRIWRLKDSTQRKNMGNLTKRSHDLPIGVWKYQCPGYTAHISIARTHYHLGVFSTIELAHKARIEAEKKLEADPLWRP